MDTHIGGTLLFMVQISTQEYFHLHYYPELGILYEVSLYVCLSLVEDFGIFLDTGIYLVESL